MGCVEWWSRAALLCLSAGVVTAFGWLVTAFVKRKKPDAKPAVRLRVRLCMCLSLSATACLEVVGEGYLPCVGACAYLLVGEGFAYILQCGVGSLATCDVVVGGELQM